MSDQSNNPPTVQKRINRVHRRSLLYRRIIGVLIVLIAAAAGFYTANQGLNFGTLLMGAGCVLLLLEALMLFVDLPVSKGLQAILGTAAVLLLAGGFIIGNYASVDGKLVPRYKVTTSIRISDVYPEHFEEMESLVAVDMRGSTVAEFTPLYRLESLKWVDIRDNHAFTQHEYDALHAALPGCAIRWSIPVGGTYFDSDLEYVDLTGLDLSTSALRDLFAAYPEKAFDYKVPLYGKRYATDTKELDLQGQAPDAGVLDDALGLLPEVNSVDLRGVKTPPQTVSMLCEAYPDVHFMFTCDVFGDEMTTEDREVRVTGTYEDLLGYVAYLPYMPNLEVMDANSIALTEEQVDSIVDAVKTGKLKYSLTMYGQKVSSQATKLNLDKVPISSVEEAERILSRLPNLTYVSMCDCGLSQEEMGQLFDSHPDIKFVWWIEFGHYRLRTDATSFTTALGTGNRYGYDDSTFEPIRYCTDLMMLDLGHNHITSLENFRGLTKLRVLIMADNKLTDISPIADFKDLEFVELFLNDITDLTPLTGLTKLMDLNVFYNPLYDNYKVLKSMTWLKRLWIGGCRLSGSDVKALRQALPDTRINVEGRGSTGKGWRKHPHYDVLKQMYEEGRYIPFEDSQTG